MSNAILERIHQVLGNLVRTFNISHTYVEKYDLWTGILAAAEFGIQLTRKMKKGYSSGQLIFVRDTILLIEQTVGWELICKKNQTQSINITFAKIYIELTTNIKSEITSCSINTLHTNMKGHIRAHF